jgi:prepilin-type N-terminal cleavage/methylation domain-containing protein
MKKFCLKKNKTGYTLIELIVVISVILILAALAIPGFESMRDRAKIHAAKEALQMVRFCQNFYKQEHETYSDILTPLYKYGNLTRYFQELDGDDNDPNTLAPIISIEIDGENGFTITARARDPQTTLITATERRVYP